MSSGRGPVSDQEHEQLQLSMKLDGIWTICVGAHQDFERWESTWKSPELVETDSLYQLEKGWQNTEWILHKILCEPTMKGLVEDFYLRPIAWSTFQSAFWQFREQYLWDLVSIIALTVYLHITNFWNSQAAQSLKLREISESSLLQNPHLSPILIRAGSSDTWNAGWILLHGKGVEFKSFNISVSSSSRNALLLSATGKREAWCCSWQTSCMEK